MRSIVTLLGLSIVLLASYGSGTPCPPGSIVEGELCLDAGRGPEAATDADAGSH